MPIPSFRVEVWPLHAPSNHADAPAASYAQGRLYFLRGRALDQQSVERLCRDLLSDPVTERAVIGDWGLVNPQSPITNPQSPAFIEVTLLPGVTDSVAENLLRAARLLGVGALEQAATGQRITFHHEVCKDELQQLATAQFSNAVIQRFTVNTPIAPPFIEEITGAFSQDDIQVEIIALKDIDDDALLALSKTRRLSLDLAEMQAIQAYYQREHRDPTDVELEMLAQTWSEHCVHKTFKALISLEREAISDKPMLPANHLSLLASVNGLLKTYIRAATDKVNKPWVRSAFVDNAGIIAFDEHWDLAFKVETHNHPSALEPFGGANTGLGGCIRDVLGVSARPIANTDVLCFGPRQSPIPNPQLLAGVLPPQRVYDGVVRGIEDYGNKMGIPTVNGAILFDPGYTANPLVFAGCLGILPASKQNAIPKKAGDGDLIVVIGGRTGRDGLRGATFSSMEMDTTTSTVAGSAVQIGHPIHEKQTQEAVLQAYALGLYSAITDCGAGGFSSAVGEMASGLGAMVQLNDALLKYPGLQPWEIWLSEAQERMVLAVPPAHWPQLKTICDGQDIEAFVLGTFAATGRLKLLYGEHEVGNLDIEFLHDGIPQRKLKAEIKEIRDWRLEIRDSQSPVSPIEQPIGNLQSPINLTQSLLNLLSHPNIRSKEDVVRKYDHEVKGQTAVKPFVGVANHGPGDAAVLVIGDSQSPISNLQSPLRGIALSNGICPQFTKLDPYAMAWAAIDEAVRNAVAVGADPDRIAILDNFCWGNPALPDRLGSLVECARGCYDAAVAYGTPFISGKDSLNNEYADADGTRHAIPGTLLISAVGIVPDVNRTVTMDLKQEGNFLFVVGDTRDELGGSHFLEIRDWRLEIDAGQSPISNLQSLSPQPVPAALDRLRGLHNAIAAGWVASCHDCSEGGLGVALAEMCLAGRLGAEMDLARVPAPPLLAGEGVGGRGLWLLFSESLCRFVVEVKPEHVPAFEEEMQGLPCAEVGRVWDDGVLRIRGLNGESVVWADVSALEEAFCGYTQTSDIRHQTSDVTPTFQPSNLQPSNPPTSKRVLILHANGTNRDHDAAAAIALAGGLPEIVHINQLINKTRRLSDYHMLIVPGGFAYGDDLGSGVLWALNLREQLGEAMQQFIASGRPVLGICNGFQTLVKAGFLPGGSRRQTSDDRHQTLETRRVTLTFNASNHFECRWVELDANPNSPSLFTKGLSEPIYCPVAHGEGRFVAGDANTLRELQTKNLIALSYVGEGYPANPNGSIANIAGICNEAGNVLGLMPHPENHIYPWQHPRWHRGERGQSGLGLFVNGLKNA